jgi:hypothetical protein
MRGLSASVAAVSRCRAAGHGGWVDGQAVAVAFASPQQLPDESPERARCRSMRAARSRFHVKPAAPLLVDSLRDPPGTFLADCRWRPGASIPLPGPVLRSAHRGSGHRSDRGHRRSQAHIRVDPDAVAADVEACFTWKGACFGCNPWVCTPPSPPPAYASDAAIDRGALDGPTARAGRIRRVGRDTVAPRSSRRLSAPRSRGAPQRPAPRSRPRSPRWLRPPKTAPTPGARSTPHPAPRTPHPAPRTPHPAPRTPHPAPRTPHPDVIVSASTRDLQLICRATPYSSRSPSSSSGPSAPARPE